MKQGQGCSKNRPGRVLESAEEEEAEAAEAAEADGNGTSRLSH